ncbi:MAG: tyrosine-type recombinase/integrase [Rhodobacteraceae bacterium]|nr:tyrosine-type recombinase/integrase [Paracoccaceae bacterium]
MNPLTELTIRSLPNPSTGSAKHFDPALPGFGVRCSSRSKSFFVQFGPQRRLKTIGKWPHMSLKNARLTARQLLVSPPPISKVVSFEDAKTAFLEDCATRLRPSTVERYRYSLKPIAANTLNSVPKTATDPHQIATLKVFFNWCIDRDLTDHNPYARRKVLMRQRDRVLTDDEVAKLMAYDHPPYSTIVKLLCLTGQRRAQIVNFNMGWIDGDTITFPSSIMKSRRAHTIPLSGYSALLGEFNFQGWSKAKKRIEKHTGVTDWVLHDLRRYFSSTMARLGVPLHVTEQILDHRSQISGVAAIYNRYSFLPEMRDALEQYEKHVETLLRPHVCF